MKQCTSRSNRHHFGVTYIEVLVASLIVSISLAAMSSLWYFSYRMSAQTDKQGVSYSIGRRALEEAKQTGFDNTAEGATTRYYDQTGGGESTTQVTGSIYSVTTSVVSDQLVSGSPAPGALRTVTVTVKLVSTGAIVHTTTTYQAKAGI